MEEKIARAYWECVVNQVQWKYAYGYRLPASPPAEFTINGVADSDSRARYWRRLQQVWYLPTSWKKDYEWDTSWATQWFVTSAQWLYSHIPFIS